MRRRVIHSINKAELAPLSTKMLLGRLKALLQCEASPELTDRASRLSSSANSILFKNTEEWRLAYEAVKAELASREHIPKGKELESLRLAKHKLQRTKERKARR